MAKKNKMTQIMAFLALFGIIIGIIGTGLLVFFSGENATNEQTNSDEQAITAEQYAEIQKYIDSQSGALIETGTGVITGTGEIK